MRIEGKNAQIELLNEDGGAEHDLIEPFDEEMLNLSHLMRMEGWNMLT